MGVLSTILQNQLIIQCLTGLIHLDAYSRQRPSDLHTQHRKTHQPTKWDTPDADLSGLSEKPGFIAGCLSVFIDKLCDLNGQVGFDDIDACLKQFPVGVLQLRRGLPQSF